MKNPEQFTIMMTIKAVEDTTGIGKLYGLRKTTEFEYELTLEKEEDCEQLLDGIQINGQCCEIRKLCATERMVSFLHLPNYINDEDVLQKLTSWGVTPILPLRRRYYPGTTVADGTRFIRVKFPKDVVSLPYNTRFETEEGTQFFRVIHDHQVKTCRICASADHEKKDCPQLICRECLEQGHYAQDCKAPRCQGCGKAFLRCVCKTYEEEHEEMETETLNDMENVEEDDEGSAPQQTRGLTVEIQSREEGGSKNEQNGEKDTEIMTDIQLLADKVEQDGMKNKEEDNDGAKDSTNIDEVRDFKNKTIGGKESVKKNILSGGSKLKTTGQINIEKELIYSAFM